MPRTALRLGLFALIFAVATTGCGRAEIPAVTPSPAATARQSAPLAAADDSAQPTFVFFGDSITYGVGSAAGACAPATLTSGCFADRVTRHFHAREVNFGVSGSCLEYAPSFLCNNNQDGVYRYKTQLLPYCARKNSTIFIMLGTNDAVTERFAPSPYINIDHYTATLDFIVVQCENRGEAADRIVLAQIPYALPTAADRGFIVAADEAIRSLSAQLGTRFAATYPPTAKCAAACLIAGGLHPNPAGHKLLAHAFEAALDEKP